MRTKALILSAMVCVAGALSSAAQNVYSINVVGYINLTQTNTFMMVGDQLLDGAGNLVTNIYGTTLPDRTVFYKFIGSGYQTLTWLAGPRQWTPPTAQAMTMLPGEGVIVKKPTAAAQIDMTFVGEVRQGDALANNVVLGYGIYSTIVPQAGGLVSVHNYSPTDRDVIYKWDGAFNAGAGRYVSKTWIAGTGQWVPPPNVEPSVAVGEAFWIKAAAAQTWTRCFRVSGDPCP